MRVSVSRVALFLTNGLTFVSLARLACGFVVLGICVIKPFGLFFYLEEV